MDQLSLLHRIALSSSKGINLRIAGEIMSRCGSLEQYFGMSERQLSTILGFKSKITSDAYRREMLAKAASEVEFVNSNSISTMFFTDEVYPQRLLECEDAPVLLYGYGKCELNKCRIIAVVGTRHATGYGLEMTRQIISDLAAKMSEPLVVVSGLAFGIDAAAHKGAIDAGIATAGVLAHGLNTIYPAAHRQMAADIVKRGGMLLTDYRSDDAIHRGNFLARNRIVAGSCDCLLVVESAERGGALVTARLAGGYNREVFAVPGRAHDTYSRGCNNLINHTEAHLVTSADDIIRAMNWPVKPAEGEQPSLFVEMSPEEEAVVEALRQKDGIQFGEILVRLNLPTSRLMGLLVDMEFKGLISAVPGGRYRLNV